MLALPLISHTQPHAPLAWCEGRIISAAQFLQQAEALAARLPPGTHVLNLCTDRYHFAVATAAALLRNQCSLLPSTQAPEVLRQLAELAPALCCLHDGAAHARLAALHCPALRVEAVAAAGSCDSQPWQVPQIPTGQLAALIFTSGSTGAPVPHAKRFGDLVRGVRAQAQRLQLSQRGGYAVLGTVPAQHMFGFESTVLLPLQSEGVLCAARPFFPADVAAALAPLPRPRALCTTPLHLSALLSAGLALPPLDLILCATAPLSTQLARSAEEHYAAPLWEIYGTTETGHLATRRTALEAHWQLWPDVRLSVQGQKSVAYGGHVPEPTLLADVLQPLDEQRFLLHGRSADLVNIAGKRSSLAYLSHQLNAVPGVQDGAFFLREDVRNCLEGVSRLGALAVAPGLQPAHIVAALRERIDPVFLPRPLLLVERLPRNDTGKLPQQALQALAAELAARAPGLFE
jgi:acyl-coenzyme A synthetase/AMP-(fatty) acid ligase